MRMFESFRWSARIPSLALLGTIVGSGIAIALSTPTAAVAQISETDQAFVNDLNSFLQSQNALAYEMVTDGTNRDASQTNVDMALFFCSALDDGNNPQELYEFFTVDWEFINPAYENIPHDESQYALELYMGSVMNLGSAYYCPQYNSDVVQALRSL